jgi:beta-lactamase class A
MKRVFYISIGFIISSQFACMIKKTPMAGLEFEIEKKLFIDSAHFGVAFKNGQTGETLLMNEKESFHAASTMKMPVLIELYRQAKAGIFSMTDSIVIKNSFKSIVDGSEYSLDSADDSQFELYKAIGQKRSIAELAYIMIILSSNMATNMLIELVTADSVMRTMKQLGAKDIKVLRGVEDSKAFEKGLNNTTTAYDQMLLYNLLAKEKLVDSTASKEMTNILLNQKFNEVIPAKLPTGVKVAHKTGSITGVQHDAGIVMLPDGRKYVLVLLSKFKPADEKKAIQSMADVSKIVYDYMMSHH